MPGMHLCECWSTLGVSAVTAYGKTILFEIDTSGIDLITLPLFLHGANRPQIWFEKKPHWAFILTHKCLLLLFKIDPRRLVCGTKKIIISV